eukprot:8725140-Pyramimonas_sp.AAC.1
MIWACGGHPGTPLGRLWGRLGGLLGLVGAVFGGLELSWASGAAIKTGTLPARAGPCIVEKTSVNPWMKSTAC